jgi:hypothetical protein
VVLLVPVSRSLSAVAPLWPRGWRALSGLVPMALLWPECIGRQVTAPLNGIMNTQARPAGSPRLLRLRSRRSRRVHCLPTSDIGSGAA